MLIYIGCVYCISYIYIYSNVCVVCVYIYIYSVCVYIYSMYVYIYTYIYILGTHPESPFQMENNHEPLDVGAKNILDSKRNWTWDKI